MRKLVFIFSLFLYWQGWSQKAEPVLFREKVFDFGSIRENQGNADHEFVFTNTANTPVKILSVQASCGCTTPDWTRTPVPPGKSGFIKASFNPKGRPGFFNKSLTVVTDFDPAPVLLYIKGDVVTETHSPENEFTAAQGNLRFTVKALNFEKLYVNRDPVQKTFPFINAGAKPIELKMVSAPPYIKVELPMVIGPNAKGNMKITYDARKKNEFGFASDNIQITTNDPGSEIKLIPIYATLEEYYPVPTPDEAKKGPILYLKEPLVDLGRIKASDEIEKAIGVRNTGKKELQIKALQSNCPCVIAELSNKSIKPGDSTRLTIRFKPQNRGGTQLKAITLYSNDPLNSVQRLSIQAYIED